MALLKPAVMQAVTGDPDIPYPASEFRASVLGAMFSREGVYDLRGGDLKVTQRTAGANMTVEVAPGRGAIKGDDASDQGMYAITNTTPYSLFVPAPPASGSRTHRVIARIRDKSANAEWNVYDWIPELLADTGTGLKPEPPSAITLATVTVPAGAGSVVNSMISDAPRKRASVGTAAVDGFAGAFYKGFSANDSTRPVRWSVNPDGWVQLSGFLRWIEPNTIVPAWEQRTMGGTPLNDPAVKPPGIRDFCAATAWGPVHMAVFPNGTLYFRFDREITLQQNQTWFSFDGCFYRI